MLDRTRTKLICTIGPASHEEATLRALIRTGMDVARINLSHGSLEEHAKDIATVRRIAKEERAVVAIMADLQGPKLRIGDIQPEPLVLSAGDRVVLTTNPEKEGENTIHLPDQVTLDKTQLGETILLDDGEFEIVVEEKTRDALVCRVIVGGRLYARKGVHIPNLEAAWPALTLKDKEDAHFAIKHDVDFLALSFVKRADDINRLRALIEEDNSPNPPPAIVAKIERREALEDFDALLDATDAIMVARGDLGVEASVQEVPFYQKMIIQKCNHVGKPVITATQMLQSMTEHPRPTRAEASDVANAILDGSDALMLSAETATGRYPVRTLEMMRKIAENVEEKMPCRLDEIGFTDVPHRHPITDAISEATRSIARDLNARLIVTSTWSGYTARQVSRERPRQPIVALTSNEKVCRQLALVWGVIPVLTQPCKNTEEMLQIMEERLLSLNLAEPGDLVIVTGGLPLSGGGKTNFLKAHRLK
jgi:pyruvate kinase